MEEMKKIDQASNASEYFIRQATISDIPTLTKMRWEHIMSYDEYNKRESVDRSLFDQACEDFLRNGIESGQWVIFVAQQHNQLVGHAYIHVIQTIPKPHELHGAWGYVSNMYVEKAHRKQGIGKKLLDATKKWATSIDLELLLLWPSEKSVGFYLNNGFKTDETLQYTIKDD